MYYEGDGVPQDKGKVIQLYQQAAEQGQPLAQVNLAILYYTGEDVPKDEGKVKKLFQQAAEQGNPNAKQILQELQQQGQ